MFSHLSNVELCYPLVLFLGWGAVLIHYGFERLLPDGSGWLVVLGLFDLAMYLLWVAVVAYSLGVAYGPIFGFEPSIKMSFEIATWFLWAGLALAIGYLLFGTAPVEENE